MPSLPDIPIRPKHGRGKGLGYAARVAPYSRRPMLTCDGVFLCHTCVSANSTLINANAGLPYQYTDTWGCIGPCGLRLGPYYINRPSPDSRCSHCNGPVPMPSRRMRKPRKE